MSDTLTRPSLDHTDADDRDRMAHYADKNKVTEAYVAGTTVVALCGWTWTPSRDPAGFPVCAECKRIYERLPDTSA